MLATGKRLANIYRCSKQIGNVRKRSRAREVCRDSLAPPDKPLSPSGLPSSLSPLPSSPPPTRHPPPTSLDMRNPSWNAGWRPTRSLAMECRMESINAVAVLLGENCPTMSDPSILSQVFDKFGAEFEGAHCMNASHLLPEMHFCKNGLKKRKLAEFSSRFFNKSVIECRMISIKHQHLQQDGVHQRCRGVALTNL